MYIDFNYITGNKIAVYVFNNFVFSI